MATKEKEKTRKTKSSNSENEKEFIPVEVQEKTLMELGPSLPLGVPSEDGTLIKNFNILPWTGKMERKVGKAKKKNPTLGHLVPSLLEIFCSTFGGKHTEDMKDGERKLLFHNSYLGDVLYSYFYLRKEEIGNIVYLVVKCPYCGHMMKRYPADLNTLKILHYPDGTKTKDLYDKYILERPISIGETKCKTLILHPAKWTMMTQVTQEESGDGEAFKLRMIKSSVVNVEELGGDAFFLQDDHVDLIHRRDIDKLANKISTLNAGPEVIIEGKCESPHCGGEFIQTIDWTYDNFFSVSSQSMSK